MINKKLLLIIFIAYFLLNCFNKQNDKKKEFLTLNISKHQNQHYLSLNVFNTSKDTVAFFCSGFIRENSVDSSLLYELIYNTILEIKVKDEIIRSDMINGNWAVLTYAKHQMHILSPDSSIVIPIVYHGNLKDDFSLKSSNCLVRAIIELPDSCGYNYFLDDYEKTILKKNPEIKIICESIKTSWCKVIL